MPDDRPNGGGVTLFRMAHTTQPAYDACVRGMLTSPASDGAHVYLEQR